MASIGSFSGLASGIQWRDMIDQIMQLERARRVTPLINRVSTQEARINAWTKYQGLVAKLKISADSLKDGGAFNLYKAAAAAGPSGRALISATASATAAPGNYNVEVIDLARAEKISGSSVADANVALNQTGQVFVNGRAVDIAAGDSLSAVRDKINAVNSGSTPSGVTATILSTSTTAHTLVLTSDQTGSRGIELVDSASSGGVLQSLGVLNATKSANVSPTDAGKTQSQRFSSTSSTLASMLGVTAPPATTTIEVEGRKITVDLTSDTLMSLMTKIAAAGGSSSTVQESVGGRTLYRLDARGSVTADATATDPAASQRIVELLGFQKAGQANQIAAGGDAKFQIDNFTMTRRSNTVSDAIAGVTINLLATDAAQRTSTLTGAGLSMLQDPKTIDPGTYAIGVTSGTTTTRTTSTSSGSLSVTSAPMTVAAGTYNVESVVTRTASASSLDLSVLAAPSTVTAGSYAVNVTQVATRSTVTGTALNVTYTGNTADTMTITDNVTGVARAYSLTAGQTLDSVVAGLNTMFSSNGMKMSATNSGGYLKLTHTDYGSAGSFRVVNNHARVANNYGVGSAAGVTYANGVNVAGTIGGLAATGSGQVLTGGAGTAIDGLQVRYSGTLTGSPVGTVTLTDTITGTIGGQNATWNAGTQTFTGAAGTPVEGLAVGYSGSFPTGTLAGPTTNFLGTATLSDTTSTSITGATIGGMAAVWDSATSTIRGAVGSNFDGLELSYTGPAVTGTIGSLTVQGEIGVDLAVTRDVDASIEKVKEFATAYSAMRAFVNTQRTTQGVLGTNGTLRASMNSITDVLLNDVSGVTTAFKRTAQVGIALTKDGTLALDESKLRSLLESSPNDVEALLEKFGEGMWNTANRLDRTGDGTIVGQIDSANTAIGRVTSRLDRAESFVELRRVQLVKQFSAMEDALGKIQSQGNWMLSQLSSLQNSR